MAQSTFNPNTGGDGQVWVGNDSNWNTVHDATSGTAESSNTTDPCGVDYTDKYWIKRIFLPFDISSIPTTATITSATLQIYVTETQDDDNDGDDWINVVQSTQASSTALVNADYNQCGAVDDPTEGATRIDISNISSSAYSTFTLNATGIGWVQAALGGYVQLGLREGHDALDNPMAASLNSSTKIVINTSDNGSNKPILTVNYTVPPKGIIMF